MKHHQLQPNIILIMLHYKPTPRSLNFINVYIKKNALLFQIIRNVFFWLYSYENIKSNWMFKFNFLLFILLIHREVRNHLKLLKLVFLWITLLMVEILFKSHIINYNYYWTGTNNTFELRFGRLILRSFSSMSTCSDCLFVFNKSVSKKVTSK